MTVTLVASEPPRLTVAPEVNRLPVMFNNVPPLIDPELGEIAVTIGGDPLLLPNRKLSKITLPGAFPSGCQVPPLSSKIVPVSEIEELQISLYRCTHVPGVSLLAGAVSRVTLPVAW